MPYLNKTVSIRSVQRQYKDVVATVQNSDRPVIVMNRSQSQLAMISLELLDEYERLKSFAFLESIRTKNKDLAAVAAFREISQEVESSRLGRYEKTSSNN
ncbi:MAG: hypothetical protein GW947_02150 [Candidatus Pacebacteria bacterium]|nr:hypothetical protein [Candidatus Paceibacterota bacterium]PIR59710.1 MAG: hypothetical protein COU68_04120 [Candidatus Pacebacteria bacterium CG10_big_fil_rev_8_21_14_0_10_45_6]